MEPISKKYFYTHTRYFDCPTCDSNGFGDIEYVHISPTFDNKKDLLDHIFDGVNETHFGKLYTRDDWGEISTAGEIIETTGFHRVRGVEVVLEGYWYKYFEDKESMNWKKDTNDEGFKRLYIDE